MKPISLLLLPLLLLAAAEPARDLYVLSGEYAVTINGTSNVRDWKENVGKVTGAMEAAINPDGSIGLTSIRICMDALSIKSDMGRVMDNKTYEALKAGAYPEILFTLSNPQRLMPVKNCETTVPVKGWLSLAGIRKPVIMQVKTCEISQGKLRFEGYENLNMNDFGVRPPTALFGTMRAAPDITIHFKTDFINQTISNNQKN
ncbi:MAG TPA: YceI family protein [Puia sp.]|nr:YceI family protein [Puia sp.]